jgi:hypothetical protein
LDGYFLAAPVYSLAKSQAIGKKVRAKVRLLTGAKSAFSFTLAWRKVSKTPSKAKQPVKSLALVR